MRNVKTIYHIEKDLHMINVEPNMLCGEICHWFVATYVVLLQNLFCRNLRCFVAEVEPNIVLVEKKDKYQVCLLGIKSTKLNTHCGTFDLNKSMVDKNYQN